MEELENEKYNKYIDYICNNLEKIVYDEKVEINKKIAEHERLRS